MKEKLSIEISTETNTQKIYLEIVYIQTNFQLTTNFQFHNFHSKWGTKII